MGDATPLRSLHASAPDASPDVLGASPMARIGEMLAATDDLSSWSDDLAVHVDDWFVRFHLSPMRANVLRGLDLGRPGTVLEVGAAGGALTRYLGEIATTVDALETDPARAAVARRRCSDLPGVVVHEVDLADVPAEPAYDVVVLADVPADDTGVPPHERLRHLLETTRALLRPGGTVILAVDNSDGVRRLAGGGLPAPRPDGPLPLAVNRADLEQAAEAAGLPHRVLGAFPDHRHTAALLDHAALRAVDSRMLTRIVRMPSPPYDDEHLDGDQERHAWSDAVADGSDARRANSLLLVAGESLPDVAPATYWSIGRRAALTACNRVLSTDDGPAVVREHAHPVTVPDDGPLTLRPHVDPFVDGEELPSLIAATDGPDEAAPLLRLWLWLVDQPGHVPWDLIPRNVLVDADGQPHAIDQEWEHASSDRRSTLRRGAIWLAYDLMFAEQPPAWLGGLTVLSAADLLLATVGEVVPPDWRDDLDAEALSMASVAPRSRHTPLSTQTRKERRNMAYLGDKTPLTDATADPVVAGISAANHALRAQVEQLELARRHDEVVHRDHAIGLRAKLEQARGDAARADDEAAAARASVERLESELAAVTSSTTWRVGRRVVEPVAKVTKRKSR